MMETSHSLHSLESGGWSSGTGRPSPYTPFPDRADGIFSEHYERYRESRKRGDEVGAKDRLSRTDEREGESSEPRGDGRASTHLNNDARPFEPPPELAAETGQVPGPLFEAQAAPPPRAPGTGRQAAPGARFETPQSLDGGFPGTGTPSTSAGGIALGALVPGVSSAAAASRPAAGVIPVTGPAGLAQRGAGTRGGAPAAPWAESHPGAAQQERIQRAEAILGQLRVHLSRGLTQATLNLSPAELGRLTIRIAVRKGRVAAVVRAESPETLELLERHVPELRAALIQSGLEPDTFEFELGFGADDKSSDQRSAGRHGTHPLSAKNPEAIEVKAGGRQGALLSALVARLDSTDQGVDTYA